jgi:hypothetical protein
MLYDESAFESYKERNLYYKFFAGYFFNELISGWEQRLDEFCQLILARSGQPGGIRLSAATTHVSFDNHLIQLVKKGVDRGEFADILLLDNHNRVLVGIEAKYLSDWKHDKDIICNAKRLRQAGEILGISTTIQCLLVSSSKWGNSRQKAVLESISPPIVVVRWEELQKLCTNERVVDYLIRQLQKLSKRKLYID